MVLNSITVKTLLEKNYVEGKESYIEEKGLTIRRTVRRLKDNYIEKLYGKIFTVIICPM